MTPDIASICNMPNFVWHREWGAGIVDKEIRNFLPLVYYSRSPLPTPHSPFCFLFGANEPVKWVVKENPTITILQRR
jgi:hypothetical protein